MNNVHSAITAGVDAIHLPLLCSSGEQQVIEWAVVEEREGMVVENTV